MDDESPSTLPPPVEGTHSTLQGYSDYTAEVFDGFVSSNGIFVTGYDLVVDRDAPWCIVRFRGADSNGTDSAVYMAFALPFAIDIFGKVNIEAVTAWMSLSDEGRQAYHDIMGEDG